MGDFGGPFEAVVIGSGMSGLAAANILAKRGMKVLVLEQHYRFGGYLQSFMLHRTPFDSGCHYVGALGEGQVFDRYLRYLGVRDSITPRPLDPDGFDIFMYPGWSFAMPVGYQRFEERLVDRFPEHRRAIGVFLETVQKEVARFPMYTLADADPRRASGAETRTLLDVFRSSGIDDPRLQEILSSYRALYLVAPHETPFSMHAFVFDSFIQGAYTLSGGGNSLSHALVDALRARGGVARRRVRVTRIEVQDGRVKGIHTEDGSYEETALVIAAIDPKVAVAMLPPGAVRPVYRHRVERLRPGIGGLGAYLRVDADLSRFANANYWIRQTEGDDPVFTDSWIFEGRPPPLFITVPSAREPSWKGPAAVIAISAVSERHYLRWKGTKSGIRDRDYESFKQEIGERMFGPIRELIPELDSSLLTADYSTPLTHRDYTMNSGGAIYGIHHSIDQSVGRGVSWRTRLGGFLLSGHSVLYPGLIGATISAFYTCGELFGLHTLQREVRSA